MSSQSGLTTVELFSAMAFLCGCGSVCGRCSWGDWSRRAAGRKPLRLQNADGVVLRVADVEYPVHPDQLEERADRL